MIAARMWHCEQPGCDCTQPLVERRLPHGSSYKIEILWRGSYKQRAKGEELQAQIEELLDAAERFGIPMNPPDNDPTGLSAPEGQRPSTDADNRIPIWM